MVGCRCFPHRVVLAPSESWANPVVKDIWITLLWHPVYRSYHLVNPCGEQTSFVSFLSVRFV